MTKQTEFLGTKIAVSKLKNGEAAAFTFTNTSEKLDASVTVIKVDVKDKTAEIASWGKNNDYPQQVLKQVRPNGSASSGIRFLRKAHYGNGLVLVRNESNDEGKKETKLVSLSEVPAIKEFFLKSQMKRFWKETIADLEWFSIAFPEYILSDNFKTINKVRRQKAAWCRFSLPNPDNNLVEYVYISEKFGKETVNATSEYVEEVPLIDSYWSVEEVKAYCAANDIKKFIRPIFYPLIDEAFYPKSEWHAVVENGWLDVANSLPALKKAIFKNQLTIKYIVEIDERYLKALYQDQWIKFSPDERINIRNTIIDSVNESLTGNDNAGKAIQSMKIIGEDGKPYPAVTVTAIDDKLKDGSYLPEAEAANSEVLFALGVDPTLIGAGIPGGKLGAGSGSDKREAFTIISALKKTDRETTLEVYDFIAEYNGWDDTITPAFEHTVLETLDKNPTGSKTVTA
ncbi:MAG: hypothetical protein RJA53_1952 [Bacteroidota bacterium]|jgi:hypothetical protein